VGFVILLVVNFNVYVMKVIMVKTVLTLVPVRKDCHVLAMVRVILMIITSFFVCVKCITLAKTARCHVQATLRFRMPVLAMVYVVTTVELLNANVVVRGMVWIVPVRPNILVLAMVSAKKMARALVLTKLILRSTLMDRLVKVVRNIGLADRVICDVSLVLNMSQDLVTV